MPGRAPARVPEHATLPCLPVARSRQIILMKAADAADARDDDGMPVMGTVLEVAEALAPYNIAGDDANSRAPRVKDSISGVGLLFGPGLVLEVPTMQDEVRQVLVTMTDDDFGFPVLTRLCRALRWTMLDPETGRRFGP